MALTVFLWNKFQKIPFGLLNRSEPFARNLRGDQRTTAQINKLFFPLSTGFGGQILPHRRCIRFRIGIISIAMLMLRDSEPVEIIRAQSTLADCLVRNSVLVMRIRIEFAKIALCSADYGYRSAFQIDAEMRVPPGFQRPGVPGELRGRPS
jgi:hypothetical protein